jgi:hypothetical protein
MKASFLAVALLAFCSSQNLQSQGLMKRGLTTFHLADGSSVFGELVHTYDQSTWWHPTSETTYAVHIWGGFADLPHDGSLRFLSTPNVVAVTPPSTLLESHSYFAPLRKEGITLAQLPLAGISLVITGNSGHHLQEDGYGDFAWDFSRTNLAGQRFQGAGTSNGDYFVWGDPVYLPRAGKVVEIVRDEPDNTPGAYPTGAPNNLIGVHLGGSYFLYLLHFQQGSIPASIQVGDQLPAGTFLGLVGNAGVSLEPHLHVSMMWWDAAAPVPRMWSVPSEFEKIFTWKPGAEQSSFHSYTVPTSWTWVSKTQLLANTEEGQ